MAISTINSPLVKEEKVDIQGDVLEIDTESLHRGYFILQITDGLRIWVCWFVIK